MEAEIYKITSINEDGVSVTGYVPSSMRMSYRRMMLEQYGNVEEEGMNITDAPEDIQQQIKEAGIIQQ